MELIFIIFPIQICGVNSGKITDSLLSTSLDSVKGSLERVNTKSDTNVLHGFLVVLIPIVISLDFVLNGFEMPSFKILSSVEQLEMSKIVSNR